MRVICRGVERSNFGALVSAEACNAVRLLPVPGVRASPRYPKAGKVPEPNPTLASET